MNEGSRSAVLLFALGVAMALVLFALGSRTPRAQPSVLNAVPERSFLVLTLDVARLRASVVGKKLFSILEGGQGTTSLCGFDPLTRVDSLAVAIPEDESAGEFGIVAQSRIGRSELFDCAQRVLEKRGAHPFRRQEGSFEILEEPEKPLGNGTRSQLAFRNGGFLLLGRGRWQASMKETLEGKIRSVEDNVTHASLRARLSRELANQATIVVSAVLPQSLRNKIRQELSQRGLSTIMASVLDVSAAGFAFKAATASEPNSVKVMLDCETPLACTTLRGWLEREQSSYSRNFRLRLLGLGKIIDSIRFMGQEMSLTVTGEIPSEDLMTWIEYALKSEDYAGKLQILPDTTSPQ